MFTDLSWSHILLLMVVALVVVGPKDLPRLMQKLGRWTAKARNLADQFRNSFDEMARQSELDELRKEIDALRNAKPLAGTQQAIEDALKIPDISLSPKAKPEEAVPETAVPPETPKSETPPPAAPPAEVPPPSPEEGAPSPKP
jgi:sec-independent protein translocase protein TatB